MATRPGPIPLTAAALAAMLVAAFALLTGGQKAATLGLTQHGALITAQDAGAADAVATVAVSPGTAGQVLTVSDAGLPHWAAASGGSPWGATVVDPGTGADWTTTAAANTSAVWSGGAPTLSALSGATGRVEVDRAAVIPGTAQAWDTCVRLDVTAGDAASGTGYFLVAAWVDASNFVYGRLYVDGTLRLVYRIAGSETISGDVAGPSAGQRTGGQLWLRLHGDALGRWALLWGVGSAGALPTAWTRTHAIDVGALAVAVPATAGIDLWVGSGGGTPLSATHTVDVLAIRTTWSGSL
jgi:hypothetical protein